MERFEKTKKVSIVGLAGNIFLLIIKSIVGAITNSQAMMADAVNSAGDIFSSTMTFIGNKIAEKPKDDDHNLGHGKAEYLFSMFISISIIVVSIKLLINSTQSLIFGSTYIFSWWLVVVCLTTILTKVLMYVYAHKIAKQHKNLLIEANAQDHKNDCILTTLNLIAAFASLKGMNWVDGIVGIGISAWIAVAGIKIFIESYNVLMDTSIDDSYKQKVIDIVNTFEAVKKIEHFNSTPVGYRYQISFTIYVDGNLSTFESHEIANKIEKEIDKLEEIYLTVIHVNPI
ncbi:MAG: cation diffusion facilitator family transporter [Clostridia bacterium]